MANPEHLEILKQGVRQWNKGRKEHVEDRVRSKLEVLAREALALRGSSVFAQPPSRLTASK
jgi:hypothetical protein